MGKNVAVLFLFQQDELCTLWYVLSPAFNTHRNAKPWNERTVNDKRNDVQAQAVHHVRTAIDQRR